MFFTRNGIGDGSAFSSIWRRGPAVGVAMGVALSGVLGISAPTRSWADVQAIDVRQYSIAPGDLAKALDMLASQGNLRIVYSPELVAGLATRGVSGRFAPDEALGRLLAETELTWKAVNASTFILLRQKPPDQNGYNTAPKHDGPAAARTLDSVTISGSLIDSPQIQTATPTYTITTEDIKTRGFNSVAEALQNSVLATGSVEGPQRFASFTQGAQTINLYGLGPKFSLILLDGKPLANFGRLYDGSSSFSNLSNIPVSMIDHIDVMPGGSSSIYGSQAVASVVNIVTRQHLDGTEVSVRTGRFDAGGGASQRVSLGYAHAFGKLSALAMMELDHTSPIWGYQRALTASASANPNGLATPQSESVIGDFGTAGFFTGQVKGYISPSAGCATNLFKGSTALSSDNGNPERYGQFCGSPYIDGYTTFSNQSRSADGMLKLTYEVSDNVRIYSDVMLNWQQQKWYPGVSLWTSETLPGGFVEDADTGHILTLEKAFAPEEMPGGISAQMNRQQDLQYQVDIGTNGRFGTTNWDWDVYYLRSGDRATLTRILPITAKINDFFGGMLGPAVGLDSRTGLGMYRPDYAAFFRSITTAQYASFTQNIGEFSQTWINNARATITNTRLFGLPGGDAAFAALIEGGSEAWHEPVNPLFNNRGVYLYTAIAGGGQRSNAASAFELNLPVTQRLTFDLSGRYDYYTLNSGASNHKLTYKAGIEYRPFDSLLFRGNYATVFKAPDLPSVFLGTSSYIAVVNDPFLCAVKKGAYCNSDQFVQSALVANPRLQPTSAQTWTVGAVWSPTDKLNLSIDYLHIAIQDEVVAQDANLLLEQDAQCLLGQQSPVSAACQAITNPVNGQVQRAGVGGRGPITGITTYYANLARESTKSITASGRYGFALSHLGKFVLRLDYNDQLKHNYQRAPGQLPIDLLADPKGIYDFKSIVSGSLTWLFPDGQWSSTLYGHRYGRSSNYATINGISSYPAVGRLHPWSTFNWSLSYAPINNLKLSLLINNIANKTPPRDPTFTDYPYFNINNYNDYGREIMLQVSLKFGGKTI